MGLPFANPAQVGGQAQGANPFQGGNPLQGGNPSQVGNPLPSILQGFQPGQVAGQSLIQLASPIDTSNVNPLACIITTIEGILNGIGQAISSVPSRIAATLTPPPRLYRQQ